MIPHQYWCIGRNFSDHAAELGNIVPEKPLIFLKSGGCLQAGPALSFPPFCNEVHHELEIVLLLGPGFHPTHWTLGLDLTERKIQNELKKMGQPWELSKSFKGSAVLGAWHPLQDLSEISNLEFTLMVNGLLRQRGNTADMIFSFTKLIHYLEERFPLVPSDALFTGTPSGVAALKSGDVLDASAGPLKFQWTVK